MAYTNNDILSFANLFSGNTDAYGITEVGEIVEGKAKSKSRLIYETVSPAVIQRHLEGRVSIGIAPIRSDGTCNFGAIDIDDYKYDLKDVVASIEDVPVIVSQKNFTYMYSLKMQYLQKMYKRFSAGMLMHLLVVRK